jgi:hypothetical protein
MAHHLRYHEGEKLLSEFGVQLRLGSEPTQPSDLLCLALGIGGRQAVTSLEVPNLLGDLEPLGQQMDQRRIHVVDAVPQPAQLGGRFVLHGRQPKRCDSRLVIKLSRRQPRPAGTP